MSSDSEYLVAKIEKYIENLKRGYKIGHALHRLEQIDMTVDLLTKTGVGKVVNRVHREYPEHADLALSIVGQWKKTAQDHQERRERSPSPVERRIKKEVKEEEDDYPGESKPTNNNDRKRRVKEEEGGSGYPDEEKREKKKSKPAPAANAFLAALASGDSVKKEKPKKLKPVTAFDLNLDIASYRPMPSLNLASKQAAKADDVPFDQSQMFKPRVGLTKIFAGRKKASTLTEVPRLFDCCIRVLQNHINEIDSFGDIPYHIVKPILEKCTWQQLYEIERKNPYLEEDSDELWEKLVGKHHPTKCTLDEESWKEMFVRCENEAANKLKMLSSRISKDGKAATDKVRKVVTITEVKGLRGSRKGAVLDMPSALTVSKARKEIFESGSKAQLSQIPATVVARSSTVGSSSHRKKELVSIVKAGPKVGSLMAKTRKMLGIKRK